jgi:hypothetical protein
LIWKSTQKQDEKLQNTKHLYVPSRDVHTHGALRPDRLDARRAEKKKAEQKKYPVEDNPATFIFFKKKKRKPTPKSGQGKIPPVRGDCCKPTYSLPSFP